MILHKTLLLAVLLSTMSFATDATPVAAPVQTAAAVAAPVAQVDTAKAAVDTTKAAIAAPVVADTTTVVTAPVTITDTTKAVGDTIKVIVVPATDTTKTEEVLEAKIPVAPADTTTKVSEVKKEEAPVEGNAPAPESKTAGQTVMENPLEFIIVTAAFVASVLVIVFTGKD